MSGTATSIVTKGVICTDIALATATNGIICIPTSLVPFIPTFVVGEQPSIISEIYNSKVANEYNKVAVITAATESNLNDVITARVTSRSNPDLYNKREKQTNKQLADLFNKNIPGLIDPDLDK